MPKEFLYRGSTLSQLQQFSMDEFIKLLPSKHRRKLTRGLSPKHRKLLEAIRMRRKGVKTSETLLKTHCRSMLILPEMVGVTLSVHDGKEFISVTISPQMIGHVLGEFAITNKKVMHGNPGIGASRSSMYVPLK
ncbi:MAG: 30S ribosomal protein S19 [Candidatus Bathyarchaeota archaeon]